MEKDYTVRFEPWNAWGSGLKEDDIKAGAEYYRALRAERAENGIFDLSECIGNYLEGAAKPVKNGINFISEHYLLAAAAGAVCYFAPPLIPLLSYGALGYGTYKTADAAIDISKNMYNGNYDAAEKGFTELGEGNTEIAGALLSAKSAAKTAKEIQMMHKLGVKTLTAAQKAEIAAEVQSGSVVDAVKEVNHLFASKEGLAASAACLKPSAIAQRAIDAVNTAKKALLPKVKKERMKFSETQEGKRRAAMSSEEIQAEAEKLAQEAFDEYGTPEEMRPKIRLKNDRSDLAAQYTPKTHKIAVDENYYRENTDSLSGTIGHEAKHADLAVLSRRLPAEERQAIAAEHFLSKIEQGETGSVIVNKSFIYPETMQAPKLTGKIKHDFMQLAKSKLYQQTSYTEEQLLAMVKPLADANPEFTAGYPAAEDAAAVLAKYAKSHNFRYRFFIEDEAKLGNMDAALIKPLSETEKPAAIEAFKNGIECLEANFARNNLDSKSTLRYFADSEETLAEISGRKFEISKYQEQLAVLRSTPDFNPAQEMQLLDKIKQAENIIKCREIIHSFGQTAEKAAQNPDDKALKLKGMIKAVQAMFSALSAPADGSLSEIEIGLLKAKGKTIQEIVSECQKAYEYILREFPDTGASLQIPYLAPSAASELMRQEKQ